MTYWNGTGWEAEPPATPRRPKRARRLLGAATEASLITLLIFGLIAGTTLAARGGNGGGGGKTGGGGSLALVVVNDADADGVVSHGDSITFDVSTAADRPYVSVKCHQGGTLVYAASAGFFADYPWSKTFGLWTSMWTSGGADCTAMLYTTKDGTRLNVLATLSFYTAE